MKTKLTLVWLVLIIVLTPIGNRVYARGIYPAHTKEILLAQTVVRDSLGPNEKLCIDEKLISADGRFMLLIQSDGNLVLYKINEGSLWATGTVGSGAICAIMQSDGNLVLYKADNTPVWASNTVGGQSILKLQDDGNLVIYRNAVGAVWSTRTNTGSFRLHPNQELRVDQKLTSPSGYYILLMQSDGNLVLYYYKYGPNDPSSRQAVWSTDTEGKGAVRATMQSDGNLVLYRADNTPVWASNTVGGRSILELQRDGNLVIYRDGVGAVWATANQLRPPKGSYQKNCRAFRMSSNTTLWANCRTQTGSWQNTELWEANGCKSDIYTLINGYLACQRTAGVPSGTYLRSCNDIYVIGTVLQAGCFKSNGSYVEAVLRNFSTCTGDIQNNDGVLTCVIPQPTTPANIVFGDCNPSTVQTGTINPSLYPEPNREIWALFPVCNAGGQTSASGRFVLRFVLDYSDTYDLPLDGIPPGIWLWVNHYYPNGVYSGSHIVQAYLYDNNNLKDYTEVQFSTIR